jgi:hypothetical protein
LIDAKATSIESKNETGPVISDLEPTDRDPAIIESLAVDRYDPNRRNDAIERELASVRTESHEQQL